MNNHRAHPSTGGPIPQAALAAFVPVLDPTAIIQLVLWAAVLGLVLAAVLEGRDDA